MYYRLVEPWSLRGYENQLLLLERHGEAGAPHVLTAPLYALLSRCDGITPFDAEAENEMTRRVLARYQEKGIIQKNRAPMALAPYQAYRHFANRRIPNAFWGITGRCNQRCLHCFMASDAERVPDECTYEQALYTIEQLVACGIRNVHISGGEPLVHPDFSRIVEAIAGAGLKITRLYTNGVLLRQEGIDLFRALGMAPEIVISFDGLGTHDWMRGVPGAEDAAVRAMALSIQNGLPVRAAVNINTATIGRVVETSRYLYGLGVRSLFFVRTSESPKWLSHTGETLSDAAYCRMIVDVIRELRPENKNGLHMKFFNSLDLMPNATPESTDRSFRVYHSETVPESAWCGKCVSTVFIASDGRVLPCDAFEGGTLATDYLSRDNNIHKRPLQAILTDSEYATALRLSVEDMLACNPQCRTCQWREKCHGGVCRACGIAAGAVETGNYHNIRSDIKRRVPITCAMFRDGYYAQVIELLGDTP